MAADSRNNQVCSGAFTNPATSGAARKKATATATPSTLCNFRPARWTAPARASSSAVNLDTDWMVPCTIVLFTMEMALFTTEKAPYSAKSTTRASKNFCKAPNTMNEALANPMNSTPRPTSTARSGCVVLSASVTAAGYLSF